MLTAYISKRKKNESFYDFATRHEISDLEKMTNNAIAEFSSFAA